MLTLLFPCTGRKRAVVAKPRACTLCRECVKVAADKVEVEVADDKVDGEDSKKKDVEVAADKVDGEDSKKKDVEVEPQIELRRVRDHFICK
jgi:hypothetical protein